MKVTISVGGRFHAFYLAHQLEKRGLLKKIITSYPKFETVKYGIPRKKIRSIIVKEILRRSWNSLPSFIKNEINPNFQINRIFDLVARYHIGRSDLFVGWSSKSLFTLREAQRNGAIGVIQHGGAHPREIYRLRVSEYNRFRAPNKEIKKIHRQRIQEFQQADYIELPSSFAKRTFIEQGIPEEKILLGFRGVDLSEFCEVEKQDNVFRIVFAGGMTLQKGVHYLLRAFYELDLPNSELILLGKKTAEINTFFEKFNVRSANRPGNGEGKSLHLGHKAQSELYQFYSQGAVYCQMSIQDGFGQVIPQAMACGLPVICTVNTGGADVVEEGSTGFVIPIRDVEALKEKLLYLYHHRELCKEMGNEAKKRVSSGLSWDDYGRKVSRMYRRVLKQSDI